MDSQKLPLRSLCPAIACLVMVLVSGCGGGGTDSQPSGGGDAGPTVPATVTALFHVNVKSGEVTVTPSKGAASSSKSQGTLKPNAIFTGTAVAFNSSVLLDQPGSTGQKTLSVSVTNNWGLPIGIDSNGVNSGFRVLFGSFTNVGSFPNPKTQTTVTTFAGRGTVGSANGDVGFATFHGPAQVAVGSNGVVFVTDELNNRIRRIGSGQVTTLAGSGAASSADGSGTAASFNHPFGICQNPVDGAVLVSDNAGNKIRRVTADGRVTTIAGTGASGATNGAGNVATFSVPSGLTVDSSGTIYVGDAGTQVRKIVFNGGDPTSAARYTVSTLAGSTTPGAADGVGGGAKFALIAQLTSDPAGNLYIADQNNNKIRFVSPSGNVVTIAGTGVAGEGSGDGTLATFNHPGGIAYLNGALYVCDVAGNTIRQLTLADGAAPTSASNWTVFAVAGNGTAGSVDGNGVAARFNGPMGMAATASGALLVAGFSENKIRLISPNNGLFPIGVPTGSVPTDQVVLWSPDGFVPNAGAGGNAPYLTYPDQVVPGASSTARNWNFVVPEGVSAFEFTVSVETNTTTGTAPPSKVGAGSPNVLVRTFAGHGSTFGFVDGLPTAARFGSFVQGMATDRAGNLYLADFHNNSIRRITPNGIVSTIAGTAITGGGSKIDGPGNLARFNGPSAVAVTPDGMIVFVGDANNNMIRRIALTPSTDPTNPTNWIVSTIAGSGTQSTADGLGTTASAVLPEGVALDQSGNLYYSEDAGNRIKKVTFGGGDPTSAANYKVVTIAGDTSSTFPATGFADGTGTAARFGDPVALSCDLAGNVYVADSFNNRIRKVTSSGTVTTVAGSSFGYTDGTGEAAQLSQPNGVACDASGYLFVADTSGNRIRMISPSGVVTTVAGTGASGTVEGAGDIAQFTSLLMVCVDGSGNLYVGGTDGAIRLVERVIGQGTR